jgi:hypothetical protein
MGKTVVIGASAVSLVAGSVLGYFFAKHQLEQHYRDEAEREIAEAKKFYRTRIKRNEFATPMDAVEQLMGETLADQDGEEDLQVFKEATAAWRTYGGHSQPLADETQVIEVPPQVQRNIFEGPEMPKHSYEDEVANRDWQKPHVISKEDFLGSESNYDQPSFTYYAGDNTLANEYDEVLDAAEMVGLENLTRFGEYSGDRRVVYIRNPRLSLEIEVLLHDESYAKVVHDVDDSYLSHSDLPRRVPGAGVDKRWFQEQNTPARSRFTNPARQLGFTRAGDDGR